MLLAKFSTKLLLFVKFSVVGVTSTLENLWGEYKKIFAQGKITWKKIHARQLILKNIHAMAKKKFIQGIW